MKKQIFIKTLAVLIMFVFILSLSGFLFITDSYKDAASLKPSRTYLLDDDTAAKHWLAYDLESIVYEERFSDFRVEAGARSGFQVDVPEDGEYNLMLEYTSNEINLFENTVVVYINNNYNDGYVCSLPFLWADTQGKVHTDRYGNEVIAEQNKLSEATPAYLEDYERLSRIPIRFSLKAGINEIEIEAQNQSITLNAIRIIKPQNDITYDEYRSKYADAPEYGDILTIEGENYRLKSDSYIRGRNVANTSVIPNNPYIKLINAIDDKSFKTVGQKLLYEIDVPSDGWYSLTVKYCQPLKAGGTVYRTIEVDGVVPFAEARDVSFVHTGLNKYQNMTLDKQLYLEAGVHTIAFRVTAGPLDEAAEELMSIVREINDTGVIMRKIKGSNTDDTAKIDTNRTWDILQYMPDILEKLSDWQDRLLAVYRELEGLSGREPSYAGDLKLAAQNIARLASEPREIPNRSSLLYDDSGSAAQLTANVLQKLAEQNMSIDRFYLHSSGIKPPSPVEGFWSRIWTGIKKFYYSFTPAMNESADVKNSKGALTVWFGKPSQNVEALRVLTAQDFTQKTGIDVVFSIMPDEKKITLANSTGNNPDVAIGLSYYRPAEFAMRGMAKNLLEFNDFLDWYGEEYNLESLSPMTYEDGVFGASETQDFYVLFYRKDVLKSLGLEVPDTWDEVKRMMPTLLRNSMNFNHPLANNVGYKSFDATGMFIFQNHGNFYAPDGFTANFNDPDTLKGLREMTDLYLTYGLTQNVPNFFNAFRSGTVPIGISNFATYLQLQVSAPELAGRWDIALVPGTISSNGEISRYYSADMTAAMIFSNTEMPDEAYAFVKWWLSSETQLNYARSLQMKYGPEYVWNTGNHKAFAQMSYPLNHRQIILEQWQWQKEALRHPASYILEREVSNAWIDIVTKGVAFQPRIDDALLGANREMRRKLIEFGYLDQNGNRLKEYNIHLIDDIIAQRKEGRTGE